MKKYFYKRQKTEMKNKKLFYENKHTAKQILKISPRNSTIINPNRLISEPSFQPPKTLLVNKDHRRCNHCEAHFNGTNTQR